MKQIIAMLTICVLLVGTAGLALAENSDASAFLSILTDGRTNELRIIRSPPTQK